MPRRARVRTLALLVGLSCVLILIGGGWSMLHGSPDAGSASLGHKANLDLMQSVEGFVAQLQPSAPYRPPAPEERRLGVAGIKQLLDRRADASPAAGQDGPAGQALTQLGMVRSEAADPATGRRFAMFASEPNGRQPWGLVLVDLSTTIRLAVEVPHPNSDLRTERLAIEVFRRIPGVVVVVAGAHRRAGGDTADAAHNTDSMFHAWSEEFARRRLPQLQLHGFANRSFPNTDVVLSAGAARAPARLRGVADALDNAGYKTCRAWQDQCARLEGTTNVQAAEADDRGSVFMHMEISWSVRQSDSAEAEFADVLAKALG